MVYLGQLRFSVLHHKGHPIIAAPEERTCRYLQDIIRHPGHDTRLHPIAVTQQTVRQIDKIYPHLHSLLLHPQSGDFEECTGLDQNNLSAQRVAPTPLLDRHLGARLSR